MLLDLSYLSAVRSSCPEAIPEKREPIVIDRARDQVPAEDHPSRWRFTGKKIPLVILDWKTSADSDDHA